MTNKQQRVIAQLQDKRILVLGAGLTGLSCVRFLQENKLCCALNDSREAIVDSEEFTKDFPLCSLTLGTWSIDLIAQADILLVSPGIDLVAEKLTSVINENCQVIGDVELFCQITEKPILAVTGSNGKSTVVSLLAHVGKALGFNTVLAGNIGLPVLSQLSADVDCYILELSSFQLETLSSMNAIASCVLNISDDHLDRHKTIEKYSAIKQSIYQQSNVAVINRDEPLSFSALDKQQSNIISFGSDKPETDQFGLAMEQGKMQLMLGEKSLVALNELPLAGFHNALNYLAVLALGQQLTWPTTEMVKHFSSFSGLAHRCQVVKTYDNITWVNDSKATNVGAAIAAINGLAPTLTSNNKMILIAGGDGKGADFSPLQLAIAEHVDTVITLGKDGGEILTMASVGYSVSDIEQAVEQAHELAQAGDVVLLSPACASIDMFKNFAQRGELFVAAVQKLQEVS